MDLGRIALLLVAGVAAGVVGSTAGLASLVSYPALLLVGLSPVAANVTNTVGLIGSSIGSISGSRLELSGLGSVVWRRVPIALAGGGLGAVALLLGPPGSFETVVPFLVALASVLLLLSPALRRIHHAATSARHPDGGAGVDVLVLLCCVYGGYFGAAAGVMLLAALLARTDRVLPVSNAVKNLLLGLANGTAAAIFATRAPVDWTAVPALLLGCIAGGWFGPALVRRIPPPVLRWVIGLAGLALAVRLATQ